VREDYRRWNFPQNNIELLVSSLRKAGLDIPDEPAKDD
jgi:hypothetical protein